MRELYDWSEGGYVGAEDHPPRDYVYDFGLIVAALVTGVLFEMVRERYAR